QRWSEFLARRGPWLAALLAGAASLPGVGFPFLGDDWLLVEAAAKESVPSLAPYGYFRPLYMATFWLAARLFGTSPIFFHLTNIVLISVSAGLAVVLIRRYTGDAVLAGSAGLLFALHPYHVDNAALVASRTDPL